VSEAYENYTNLLPGTANMPNSWYSVNTKTITQVVNLYMWLKRPVIQIG